MSRKVHSRNCWGAPESRARRASKTATYVSVHVCCSSLQTQQRDDQGGTPPLSSVLELHLELFRKVRIFLTLKDALTLRSICSHPYQDDNDALRYGHILRGGGLQPYARQRGYAIPSEFTRDTFQEYLNNQDRLLGRFAMSPSSLDRLDPFCYF
jgi:hypothetical protein